MFRSLDVTRDVSKLKAIDSILSRLGELPVAERMTQVADVLTTVEEMSISGRRRIQTLEACRAPVLAVAEDIQQSLIVQSLPIGQSEFKRVTSALSLLQRLASLYAGSPNEQAEKSKKVLRLALHRELELCEIYLVLALLAYIPLPNNFWRLVHSVIRRADSDGLAQFKPPGSDNRLALTTGQLYVAAILIGLSDPYQLGFREILRVREVATLLANRVDLIADSFHLDPENRRYVFLVDENSNKPAMPWGTGRDGRLPEGSMVLDVSEVVTRVRRTHRSLTPESVKFDATFPDEPKQSIMSLYEHLMTVWAKQPIRKLERRETITGYKVCVGLDDIVTLADNINNSNAYEDVVEIVLSGGLETVEEESDKTVIDAKSSDVSDEGVRFFVHGRTRKRIAAGEVIAFDREDRNIWKIGLIRWVQGPTYDKAEFGVRVLGEFVGVGGLDSGQIAAGTDNKPAVLVRDIRQGRIINWIISASSDVGGDNIGALRFINNGQSSHIKPLNSNRRTPFVTYQSVLLIDLESPSSVASR